MFDKDKRAAKEAERLERAEGKALEKLQQRRDWIIQKIAIQMNLTGAAFNSDISKLAQELHYLDSAIGSVSASIDGAPS